MKPKPDTDKQLHHRARACEAGSQALMLYKAGEWQAALSHHLEAKRHESAWRGYGGTGRITLIADGARVTRRAGANRLLSAGGLESKRLWRSGLVGRLHSLFKVSGFQ